MQKQQKYTFAKIYNIKHILYRKTGRISGHLRQISGRKNDGFN